MVFFRPGLLLNWLFICQVEGRLESRVLVLVDVLVLVLVVVVVVVVVVEKDSEAVLGVWLPAPLPTSRAPPDRGALWPLA